VSLAHCPDVSDELVCDHNLLPDLSTCPPARLVYAPYNPIRTLKNTPGHIHHLILSYDPQLPLLGLLSVHYVEIINELGENLPDLNDLLNAHVGKGVFDKGRALQCAAALIKAGYKSNARL